MTASDTTRDAGNESGDVQTVKAPSKEQIDAVFASAIEAVDGETDSWMNQRVVSMVATFWDTVDELREEGALTVDSEKVEELRKKHLGDRQ